MAVDIIRNTLGANSILEHRHAGGSCGNVLAILSYFGIRASAVGRIGKDPAGRELLADLRRARVNVGLLEAEEGYGTPIVIQETWCDARGMPHHRFSRACPLCGATLPGFRPLLNAEISELVSRLPSHDILFFDRVAPGTLALARSSRGKNALIVFEPSGIKDERLFVECLRNADIFKYSRERLSDLSRFLRQARPPVEIQTLGKDGLRFRTYRSGRLSKWHRLRAFPAPSFRDSAGSGDWCTAGLLVHLVGLSESTVQLPDLASIADGLRFGQAIAALNCSYDGARGLMYAMTRERALRETQKLLSNAKPQLPEGVVVAGNGIQKDLACATCSSA
jgi:fructokinase